MNKFEHVVRGMPGPRLMACMWVEARGTEPECLEGAGDRAGGECPQVNKLEYVLGDGGSHMSSD